MRSLIVCSWIITLTGSVAAADDFSLADSPGATHLEIRLRQLETELRTLKSQVRATATSPHADRRAFDPLYTASSDTDRQVAPSQSNRRLAPDATVIEYPTVRTSGFIHLDFRSVHQDAANRAAVGDIQDGVHFTRARVSFQGQAWENTSYILEMDFGLPDRPTFVDLFVDYDTDTSLGHFRVGRWRQPFGMDALTSIRSLTFLERASLFAFGPFRQTGIGFYDTTQDENGTWAVSGFRYPSDGYGTNLGDNGGYGWAARFTRLMVDDPARDKLLHLGANYSFSDPSADTVRYFSTPELLNAPYTGVLDAGVPNNVPLFVDTGAIDTKHQNQVGVELALAQGQFYAQSEWTYLALRQESGPTVGFPGMYVHCGYFLTGERRTYDRKSGVFGRVEPLDSFAAGSPGCWEVAARWSYIDLTDANISGGRMNDITLGVNWYWNPRTKFQFNYIHSQLDSPILGNSQADFVAFRLQVDF